MLKAEDANKFKTITEQLKEACTVQIILESLNIVIPLL